MKKLLLCLVLSLLVVPSVVLAVAEDVAQHPSCSYCGMDRDKFSSSRMLVKYSDGSEVGTCSLRCSAVELAVSLGKTPASIWVADYNSRELIDADKAFWVVGGKTKGVMTARGKWAFATREAAEAFVKAQGGEMVDFDEALETAYKDLYKDTKRARKMRQGKMSHKDEHKMKMDDDHSQHDDTMHKMGHK